MTCMSSAQSRVDKNKCAPNITYFRDTQKAYTNKTC